jgi:ABC-type Fe3+/spermidine/putrescine transport system ATPase subunit
VYRHPTTAFVARFVGAMNEFAAEASGGEVMLAGRRVGTPAVSAHPSGAAVTLLVRPEDLQLVADGLPGTVTSVTFQGSTTLVGVRLDVLDHLVTVDVGQGGADTLRIGDRVQVEVNGANAVVEAR